MQFNMNLAYAAGENKDLVQEISAKNAVIQNMTNMIDKLEKQMVSTVKQLDVIDLKFDFVFLSGIIRTGVSSTD